MAHPEPRDPALERVQVALEGVLPELESELGDLAVARSRLGGPEAAARLCAFERRLLDAECRSALIEGEPEAHPVLPVTLGWMEQLQRSGLVEAAGHAEALSAHLLCETLRQRERLADEAHQLRSADDRGEGTSGLRDRLFDSLLATEELRSHVEGRAGRIGPSEQPDRRTVVEEALRVQKALRLQFSRAVEDAPPDPDVRAGWAGRLVDHADETLVVALEVEDRVGVRLLGEARRALDWHVQHVERARDGGLRGPRRRLLRRMKRLEVERLELLLQVRLEKAFGRRRVMLWDRMVLLAIVLVIGLLFASIWYGSSSWLLWTDTAVCAFLVVDFLVKAAHLGFNPSWLKRHVLTDLLPAIPFGLFAINANSAELAPLLKALRVQKLARSLRLLLPVIRLYRALNFLLRGLDRIVRQNARLLMGETLVFPTPAERREARERSSTVRSRLLNVRSVLDGLFAQALDSMAADEREELAAGRLRCLRAAATEQVPDVGPRQDARAARRAGLPIAEGLLDTLSSIRSEEVTARIGPDAVARLARGARIISRSPLSRAPLVGRWVPAEASHLPDRRLAARVLRSAARSAAALHRGILWWGDLRGTLTPGELVGRVGSTLVARSARPAVRLLAIGGAYLLLLLLLRGFGLDPDDAVLLTEASQAAPGEDAEALSQGAARDLSGLRGFVLDVFNVVKRLTGVVLVVLGSICLAFLGIGTWLQRLARDATVFHEQVARAQFLHLTESIKARAREMDAALLGGRVFRPERILREGTLASERHEEDVARFLCGLDRFMTAGVSPPSEDVGFDAVARSVMLYRDLLDGALLVHSDTRATSQLLGNLALQRMIGHSGRVDASMRRTLRGLDLERRRAFIRGPYLWFHSITRALSSRSARLIVDYNAHAIPLPELDRAAPEERTRYDAWLGRSALRVEDDADENAVRASARGRAAQLTTAFTALHFLDASPARDAEVACRFGEEVLARLREDRRALVRTVFGTSPLHELPLESRVLNPRLLYAEWIEGGKVWFAPFRLAAVGFRAAVFACRALARAVATIRRPERALSGGPGGEADFHAAARKIDRMRGPGALAATELRAILDPEYCGLTLPGLEGPPDGNGPTPHVLADAEFLGADPAMRDRLTAHAARTARCLRHLEREFADGLLERLSTALGVPIEQDRETLRALALIVTADDDGIRSGLFGAEVLAEATCDALRFGLPRRRPLLALRLRVHFEQWWRSPDGGARVLRAAARSGVFLEASRTEAGVQGRGEAAAEAMRRRRVKRAAWATLLADVDGARSAFDAARLPSSEREAARSATESRLADALRHPARITEQLVTLRAIQTLCLVDVRDYRRHVWELGEYGTAGDPGDVLLEIPDVDHRSFVTAARG